MKIKHMNALLVEIMMAVLFFALSAAVILELFASAHSLNISAEKIGRAANHAHMLCEQIYAAEDAAAFLADQGFEAQSGAWIQQFEDYEIRIDLESEAAPAGALLRAQIAAYDAENEGEAMICLPCARYFPEEAMQ